MVACPNCKRLHHGDPKQCLGCGLTLETNAEKQAKIDAAAEQAIEDANAAPVEVVVEEAPTIEEEVEVEREKKNKKK